VSGAELPPFDGTARCPKCDGDLILTVWHDGPHAYTAARACAAVTFVRTSYPPEHLCRTCQRCHYRWPEAVFSDQSSPSVSGTATMSVPLDRLGGSVGPD
jgi:hypothetical protein